MRADPEKFPLELDGKACRVASSVRARARIGWCWRCVIVFEDGTSRVMPEGEFNRRARQRLERPATEVE